MDRSSAIKYINEQTPTFLDAARKRGWICPICGNGSGKDGTGIVRNPKDGKYKCFKCDFSGDVLDLIARLYGLNDFNACLKKGSELFGVTVDRQRAASKTDHSSLREESPLPPEEDISAYLKKCNEQAGQTEYFRNRGISEASVEKFRLGYDPIYDEGNVGSKPWKAVIIPTSDYSFEARNIEVEPNSETNGSNKYRKHGKNRIFNVSSLSEEKEKPIFVCEGIFDALSVIEAGGQAIALGSAVNYRSLLSELDRIKPARPLILLLDDDPAGKENTSKLANELDKINVGYNIAPQILAGYHDANERLIKDREGLEKSIKDLTRDILDGEETSTEEAQNYLHTSAAYSLTEFIEKIKTSSERFCVGTGFQKLDLALGGGIYPGLYVIGAVSSLGKTTLALQMADEIASNNRDVIFFSLEQSQGDLMSKSLSRETYRYCKENKIHLNYAKTNMDIQDGNRWRSFDEMDWKVFNSAIARYKSYGERVFIVEGVGNISVSDIREKVKKHISITGRKQLVVFVDYLQILKANAEDRRSSDKQVVDHNITALKQLSRDFQIPVIVISSLNRANYTERVNMAAFKESGSIEYGSDVLIGLQATGTNSAGMLDSEGRRTIDLCILKNRNGPVTEDDIRLDFLAKYNLFKEAE